MKVTRPPAPWLADHEIRELQSQRNELRKKAHESDDPSLWDAFRSVRNNLKTKIRRVKKAFFDNAFSSRRPREIWKTIHRVLNPCPKPLQANPNDLNAFFSTTAERTLGRTIDNSDILDLISELDTNHEKCTFDLREVTQAEVLQEIKGLRADCSTGPDQIPVKFLKPVAESLAGPLTYIINSCIMNGRLLEYLRYRRLTSPRLSKITGLSQSSLLYQRYLKRLYLTKLMHILKTWHCSMIVSQVLGKVTQLRRLCWVSETISCVP